MRGLRALPFAFFGALAWFLWTTTGQSTGSCFSNSHYSPSAASAFIIVTSVAVVADLFAMPRPRRPTLQALLRSVFAAGSLTAVGLAAAVFFSAVISCSGG